MSLPSLPELILWPETTSSRNHNSGFICHTTKPPASVLVLAVLISSFAAAATTIFTSPTAYMLFTPFNAATPPAAARYCCTMYFALQDSCLFRPDHVCFYFHSIFCTCLLYKIYKFQFLLLILLSISSVI